MPRTLHAVVTLEPASGFDMEASVNTFTFHKAGAADPLDGPNVAVFAADFFRDVPSDGTTTIGSFISPVISRVAGMHTVKVYDITGHLDGTPHGSPIHESVWDLPAATSAEATVNQVACVMTLRGRDALLAPVEGPGLVRPRSRLSGRLFVGPLNVAALDRPAAGHVRPIGTFRSHLRAAAEMVQDEANATGYTWVVWSRAAANVHAITRVEVDDSFDVLRSRKIAPTVREARAFAPVPDLALGA